LELVLNGRRRLRFAAEIDPAALAGIVAALEALDGEPRPC
jgi:hypothetical protein